MCTERLVTAVLLTSIVLVFGVAPAHANDPVIAAAGDIACDPGSDPTKPPFNNGNGTATECRQKYTSDLVIGANPDRVLPLGDLQYDAGKTSEFQAAYIPTWGRFKSITTPVIGNHESNPGYYDYFGRSGNRTTAPGAPSEGFYSYDLGAWHLIALNSNCSRVACEAGSSQEQWLRADLAAHPNSCKLAYWHHPRFSSGHDHDNTFMQPIWQALYEGGVKIALTGHSHDYERFWPMDANGNRDDANGITEFVVGTGGAFFTGISSPRANSAVRNASTYGVLFLTLGSSGYNWQFVPESGSFTDSGSGSCGGGGPPPPPPDSQPPSAPANVTATAPSLTRIDLSWGASSDNVGVTGYEIYKGGALLATTTGTNYTDSTVSAGTTYTYQVKARDAAGNRSAFSNGSTVTTPGTTLRLPAQADAHTDQANPASNFGTGTTLRADGGSDPDVVSHLRFNVLGVSGTVESAKLRVYAQSGTADGPAVQSTTSGWSETELNWNNRPVPTSAATDDKGSIATNTWVEYNVKPFVTGSGTYSFILAPTSNDGVDFASREFSDATRRPQLLLTVTDTLIDNGLPPDTAITSGPIGATNSPSAGFAFSSSESPAAFECRLDSSGWTGCSSPKAYTGLTKGSHTFRVRATDQFGNTDATDATRSWSVVYLPSASFDFSPSAPSVGQPVTFTSTSSVVGTDAITKHEWDLDGNGSFETSTGAVASVSRSYPTAATTAVTLRVTDTDGDTSTATKSLTVSPLPPVLSNPPAPPPSLPGLVGGGIVGGDVTPPKLVLGGPTRQRLGGRFLTVLVQCDEPCTATGSARVSIKAASGVFRSKQATSSLRSGARGKLRLRFSKKATRAMRRSLGRGKRLHAMVEVVTRDRTGNASSAERKIRLKR